MSVFNEGCFTFVVSILFYVLQAKFTEKLLRKSVISVCLYLNICITYGKLVPVLASLTLITSGVMMFLQVL